jgi:hypothetical protein
MGNNNESYLTKSIKSYLVSNDITHKSLDDDNAFIFRIKADDKIIYEILVSVISADKCRIFVFFPQPIPDNKVEAAYYLINSLNNTPLGCTFVFDKTDNMIISQNIISAFDGMLSEHILSTTIQICVHSLHLVSNIIMDIIDADESTDFGKIILNGMEKIKNNM